MNPIAAWTDAMWTRTWGSKTNWNFDGGVVVATGVEDVVVVVGQDGRPSARADIDFVVDEPVVEIAAEHGLDERRVEAKARHADPRRRISPAQP